MHPLPAFRGEEITAEVIDGPKSIVWDQAKSKMLISQALIMYLSEKNLM
jgi:ornithine carbamoyltransferase